MHKNRNSENYSGPHFMLNHELLKPGDIILERGYARHSEIIAKQTGSYYSHAMIYTGETIIEATHDGGVFSRIPNRSTVRGVNDFKVLRLKIFPGQNIIDSICNQARYLSGSQYSVVEALKVKSPQIFRETAEDTRKQFCSRLVAQCYNKAGIDLVDNINFCSPGDFEKSDLLYEVTEMVYRASEEEISHALSSTPHSLHTENTVKFVRSALRIFKSHGIKTVGIYDNEVIITTLSDISMAIYQNSTHPGLDEELTDAMTTSGYLDHIDVDRKKNPYRYDPTLFRLKVEQASENNEYFLFEILRQEINKELSVIDIRLQSYIAGRENLKSGLMYAKAEFKIAYGLVMDILVRTKIIEAYTFSRRNVPGFREINDASRKIINKINNFAPELTSNTKEA